MKPLIVLVTVFILALLILRVTSGKFDWFLSGRIAMSVMLVFTAIGHFKFPEGMSLMIPEMIPLKMQLVYLTGILEIAAAIGLLLPNYQAFTGWFLIVFLIMVLPANVYAALNQVNYEQASYQGPGPSYLWFRVPLQLFFILWVYISAIRN